MVKSLWKAAWHFLIKLNMHSPHNVVILLILLVRNENICYTKAYTQIIISVLFIMTPTEKKKGGEGINKLCDIHTMKNDSAIKK